MFFYIAQYPVHWTTQNALQFTSWQTCAFRHQLETSLGSIVAIQELSCTRRLFTDMPTTGTHLYS